jgi:hypothetical protein
MKHCTINKSCKGRTQPTIYKNKKDQLFLSGPALVELLCAVLDKGVSFRFQAKGFSMSPFIRYGDIVTVFPIGGAPPRIGEVVAYVRPGTERLVIHRVVGKKGHAFWVIGDCSRETDGLISKANILGRVIKVERDGKEISFGLGLERILIAFLTRRGLFLRFILPAWQLIRPIVRKTAT